jgi:apolipoprotein D and lipocalin family protein
MSFTGGEIAGIVIASTVLILFLLYLFLRWYTWRKLSHFDVTIPRETIDPEEYQGTWYEIARYPKLYEEGCSRVKAIYTLEAGNIRIENQCYKNNQWTSAKGWAYPTDMKCILGVSFFPGIYGSYTVTYRDPDTSIVTDGNRKSLWILSRKSHISQRKRTSLLHWLHQHQFDTRPLTFTYQE